MVLYAVVDVSLLHGDDGVVDDREWSFTAGIGRSQHDEIAAAASGFAHQGALGTITIAAAAEDRNHFCGVGAAGNEFAGQSGEVAECVVGVGVVDDEGGGRAAIDALEHSWDMGK